MGLERTGRDAGVVFVRPGGSVVVVYDKQSLDAKAWSPRTSTVWGLTRRRRGGRRKKKAWSFERDFGDERATKSGGRRGCQTGRDSEDLACPECLSVCLSVVLGVAAGGVPCRERRRRFWTERTVPTSWPALLVIAQEACWAQCSDGGRGPLKLQAAQLSLRDAELPQR